MNWQVVFYIDVEGNEPVKDFILGQTDGAIAENSTCVKVIEAVQHFARYALCKENT